jgi:dUTP pyrophosphatase
MTTPGANGTPPAGLSCTKLPVTALVSTIPCECRRLRPDARLPWRGKPTDAGYDIASVVDLTILPGETATVSTGLELSVPEGYYWTMEGRSSLNKAKVFVVRPIIDATYTGEAEVILCNEGIEPYHIERGDRIAQILLHAVLNMEFMEVPQFSPAYSKRGRAGWGSSGR